MTSGVHRVTSKAPANDLAELKQFVVAQATSQGITPEQYGAVLDGVADDGDGGPGSWVRGWTEAGERLEREGRLLEAGRFYTMARFPYPSGSARREAEERARAVFSRWASGFPGIERLEVPTPAGPVAAWAGGLSVEDPKPLLLMSGGIISLKEQWAPVLLQLAEFGLAGVVTEMPGVGENPLPYDLSAPALLPAVLDAVAGRADTSRTYALALSFSGNLALHAALGDRRIRGIVGAGLPVHDFFTDRAWRATVPRVTVDTLAHLARTGPDRVFEELAPLALDHRRLSAVDIPVALVASARDEIIPPSDTERLRRSVRSLRLRVHDDVHGSPGHFPQTRLWTLLSVLRMTGDRLPQRLALAAQLRALDRG
ncbi:alpha/beta hydrolase [Peterkaempfera bronchialis]|uniref:Alpha/beta hydrolase n=1 Tax=Peterkaempfera bronchialis TaxID=2126346 RepID=A0A345T2K2_9ACTN|nr:alpha/beta hydrolase [Peterkaempfera bronchialis]